jgi:hypothetical protein
MLYRAGGLAVSEHGPSATWEGKQSPFRVLTGLWSRLRLVPNLSIVIGILVGTSSLGPTMSNAEDPFAAPGPSNANHQLAEKKMLSVYVSLGREHKLVHYHLDPQSGQLTRCSELEVPGTPGAQVSSSDRRRLYVSMRSIKSVSTLADRASYRLDSDRCSQRLSWRRTRSTSPAGPRGSSRPDVIL